MATHLEDLENELVSHPQRVMVIAGAGVALATDPTNECAGWGGLLRHGLKWCRDRYLAIQPERLAAHELLLQAGDLVPVATFIARELRSAREGEYGRWLQESVGKLLVVDSQVIDALVGWGVQIATTNYDTLIEKCGGLGSITWREKNLVAQFLRGDVSDVLHIHGHFRYPETVVLDAGKYEEICRDEPMQSALRAGLATRTLVFAGCGAGLNDPNFGKLLTWSREAFRHSPYSHYRLVRESELLEVAKECNGLSIHPISYGPNHSDLGPFLTDVAARIKRRRTPTSQLELLDRRQADYLVQRDKLQSERTSLPVTEYFRRHLHLARELWQFGGRRTAALDLEGVFMGERASFSREERIRFGLDVVEMLLDDEMESSAAGILQQLLHDLEAPDIPLDAVERFRRFQIRCMNDLCAYQETLAAIKRALPTASDEERVRLQAQRAEIQLLQGQLDEAAQDLDQKDAK